MYMTQDRLKSLVLRFAEQEMALNIDVEFSH